MKLELSINIVLPPGWQFAGLWFDNYDKEGTPWEATAEYESHKGSERRRVLLEVQSHGATAQAAFDGLLDEIRKTIKVITDTETWLA